MQEWEVFGLGIRRHRRGIGGRHQSNFQLPTTGLLGSQRDFICSINALTSHVDYFRVRRYSGTITKVTRADNISGWPTYRVKWLQRSGNLKS